MAKPGADGLLPLADSGGCETASRWRRMYLWRAVDSEVVTEM